jgi:hypothetical protein
MFMVQGKVEGLVLRVNGLGFKVKGLRFRVYDSGYMV